MDIPPMIASSILSNADADFCLIVVLVRVKSKMGEWIVVACSCVIVA